MIYRLLILLIGITFVGCSGDNEISVEKDVEVILENDALIETIDDDSTLLILNELIEKNIDTCKTKFYQAIKSAWNEDLDNSKLQFDEFEMCAIPNKLNGYHRVAHNTLYEFIFKKELVPLKKSIQVLAPKLDSLDYYPVSIFVKNEDGTHSLMVDGIPQTGN